MATTLAEVQDFAASNQQVVTTYVDEETPAGHFVAVTRNVNDDKLVCLLEGVQDDANAKVKGYVLMVVDEDDVLESFAYAQDAQANETPLGRVLRYSGPTESFASAFAQMV